MSYTAVPYDIHLAQVYLGLDFLQPLVAAMMHKQPERRPTAESALRQFREISRGRKESELCKWKFMRNKFLE